MMERSLVERLREVNRHLLLAAQRTPTYVDSAALDEAAEALAQWEAALPNAVADKLMHRSHAASGQAIFVDAEIIRQIVLAEMQRLAESK